MRSRNCENDNEKNNRPNNYESKSEANTGDGTKGYHCGSF